MTGKGKAYSEYWKAYTYNAWWLPPIYSSKKYENKPRKASALRSCLKCKQVYEQMKYKNTIRIVYYKDLFNWACHKDVCINCKPKGEINMQSECCGAEPYSSIEDGLGICLECKDWAEFTDEEEEEDD